jgi:hypothetical protein
MMEDTRIIHNAGKYSSNEHCITPHKLRVFRNTAIRTSELPNAEQKHCGTGMIISFSVIFS